MSLGVKTKGEVTKTQCRRKIQRSRNSVLNVRYERRLGRIINCPIELQKRKKSLRRRGMRNNLF